LRHTRSKGEKKIVKDRIRVNPRSSVYSHDLRGLVLNSVDSNCAGAIADWILEIAF